VTKPLRILVCDDRDSIAKEYAGELLSSTGGAAEVTAVSGATLGNSLTGLRKRAQALISGGEAGEDSLLFDECDVCLIDNSLLFLDAIAGDGAESIFGLVRAFTNCEFTISLNLDPYTDFDLRLLGGHPETNADLALNERHLPLRSVWDRTATGFNPSYWPDIGQVIGRRHRRRQSILNHVDKLDARIWPFFGFDRGERYEGLQDTALGYLDPLADAEAEVATTFRDFFLRSARSLPTKEADREPLLNRPDIVARVVEAELSCWLGRMVIAPQSTLVDLPHLISRIPSFVPEPRADPAQWNGIVHAIEPPFGLAQELFKKHLAAAWFNSPTAENDLGGWGERPLFWWADLRSDNELGRLDLEVTELPDLVFLEDLSIFGSEASEKPPRTFAAAFRSNWDVRSVSAGVEGFRYAPRSALAR
jgi:hypothetical protein